MSANLNALKDTLCQWDNFGYASSVLVVFGFQMLWYGPRLMGNVWEKAKGVERQNPDRQTKVFMLDYISNIRHPTLLFFHSDVIYHLCLDFAIILPR